MLIQRLHPSDDAIVALRALAAGQRVEVEGREWILREAIPAKHKFAARDIAVGERITMYGVAIGKATGAIAAGSLLSQQNVAHATDAVSGKQADAPWSAPDVSRWAGATFDGYR